MKRLAIFIFLVFWPAWLLAVKNCPACDYRVDSNAFECPKCLRLINWPYSPGRTIKAKVIVRTGKDSFIRHPNSQNRAFKSDKNTGADDSGQIGSWGFLTGLRYLVSFEIPKRFAESGIDISTFKCKRARLRLVIAERNIEQQIPIRAYPLSRPFQEGTGKFHIRSKVPDGCTWIDSAPLISWHTPGGDYLSQPSCPGILGYQNNHECIIDVTSIYQFRFNEYQKTGIWNDPGMIIMRDPETAGSCTFLSIFSLDSRPRGNEVISPQLFIE